MPFIPLNIKSIISVLFQLTLGLSIEVLALHQATQVLAHVIIRIKLQPLLKEVILVLDHVAMHALGQRPLLLGRRDALATIHLKHDLVWGVGFLEQAHNEWRVHVAWVDWCVLAILVNIDYVGVIRKLNFATFASLLFRTTSCHHTCCICLGKKGARPTSTR